MAVESINQLKSYFQTGDTPTEQHFYNFIESMIHRDEGNVVASFTQNLETGQVNILFGDNSSLSFIAPLVLNIAAIDGLSEALGLKVDKDGAKVLTDINFSLLKDQKLEQAFAHVSSEIDHVTPLKQFTWENKLSEWIAEEEILDTGKYTYRIFNNSIQRLNIAQNEYPYTTAQSFDASKWTVVLQSNTDDKLDKSTYTGTAADLDQAITTVDTKADAAAAAAAAAQSKANTNESEVNTIKNTLLPEKISKNPLGSPLRFFNELGVPTSANTSAFVTTMYIDSTIVNSNDSVLNERGFPFKTMTDAKAALTGAETGLRFYFLSSGIHEGVLLDQIDTEFDALSSAIIDVTNVGLTVISDTGLTDFTPTFNFIGGKISIYSNFDNAIVDHEQNFTPFYSAHPSQYQSYQVRLSGWIGDFIWNATKAVHPTDPINQKGGVISTANTNLLFSYLKLSDINSTFMIEVSAFTNISFQKVECAFTGSKGLITLVINETSTDLNTFISNLDFSSSGTFTNSARYNSITGTGTLGGSGAVFEDCVIDSTININFTNMGTVTGKIIGNVPVQSSYTAGTPNIVDFEGYIEDVVLVSINTNCGMRFNGNNKIYVNAGKRIATYNGITHRDDIFRVESGNTIIEATDEDYNLFYSPVKKDLVVFANFSTNSKNIGANPLFKNNTFRSYAERVLVVDSDLDVNNNHIGCLIYVNAANININIDSATTLQDDFRMKIYASTGNNFTIVPTGITTEGNLIFTSEQKAEINRVNNGVIDKFLIT